MTLGSQSQHKISVGFIQIKTRFTYNHHRQNRRHCPDLESVVVCKTKMNEEEDLAVLIYKSSKTAKARAAAAAAKEKGHSSTERRSSTRKRSSTSVNQDFESSADGSRKQKVRSICSAAQCTNIAMKGVLSMKGGVCNRHGAKKKRCSSEGCMNRAQKGGVCMKHGAAVKSCSSAGCPNRVVKGGVCVRHGAKKKRCSRTGCMNQSQSRGVCKRHGSELKSTADAQP
eukprot:scaffold514_cov121-Skeletonema_marinoi.AAC.2